MKTKNLKIRKVIFLLSFFFLSANSFSQFTTSTSDFPQGTASGSTSVAAGVRFQLKYIGGSVLYAWDAFTHPNTNAFCIYDRTAQAYRFYITPSGNVGLGTTTVTGKFQVGNGIGKATIGECYGANAQWSTSYIGFNAGRLSGSWNINNDGAHNGAGVIAADVAGNIRFIGIPNTGAVDQNLTDAQVFSNTKMVVLSDGNVGIGTTNTQGYKFAVNGGILAEEVKVITDVPASDYVFKSDYKLSSLSEVEKYVKEHQHLKGIPSAEEFKRDGYKVGQMDNMLLKQVEEMMLYLINLEKENKKLAAEVETLKTKLQ